MGNFNPNLGNWTWHPGYDNCDLMRRENFRFSSWQPRIFSIDRIVSNCYPHFFILSHTESTNPIIQTTTLTAPNGGEYLKGGSSSNITWISGDITDTYLNANPITLEYYNGTIWVEIANTEGNDGTFSWNPVPSLNITTNITANCHTSTV